MHNTVSVSIQELLAAGIHWGHMRRHSHPKMLPYVYTVKNDVQIINLEITLEKFQTALNFIETVIRRQGKILFVGTKPVASELVEREAKRCGMPYVNLRWLGGLLTNYKTMRQRVRDLKALDLKFEKSDFGKLNKKQILDLSRRHQKLLNSLGGLREMNGLPDALFIIDVHAEHIAVSEAQKLRIPVVGIVDTNSNPEKIDYMIPGNDDSMKAIAFYMQKIADHILVTKQEVLAAAQERERIKIAKQAAAAAEQAKTEN